MSPRSISEDRQLQIWTAAVVLIGLVLRLAFLADRPFGVDADQALVVLFGADTWREGKVALFQSEMTRFESPSSYLYYAAWSLFGSGRAISFLWAAADLALLFFVVRKRSGLRVALIALVILASSPWHWFYSRVTGPCVGPSALLLLYWLWRESRWRILPMVTGWFYYGAFRFAWIWEACRGKKHRWVVLGISAAAMIGLYLCFQVSPTETFRRGGYNWPTDLSAIFTRVSAWFSLFFWGPSEALSFGRPEMVVDPVTLGFSRLLGANPALTWTGAILFAATLLTAFSRAEFRRRLREPLLFLIVALVLLTASPTFSHGLVFLPFIAWMMAEALAQFPRRIFWAVVIVVPLNGILDSSRVLIKLAEHGVVESVFEDRWREIAETVSGEFPDDRYQVIFVADQSLFSARFETLKHPDWLVTLAGTPDEFEAFLHRVAGPREQVVIFDRFVPEPLADFRSGDFWAGYGRISAMEARVLERTKVLESRAITRGKTSLFSLRRVQW